MTKEWIHKPLTSARTSGQPARTLFNLTSGMTILYVLLFCAAAVIVAPAQSAYFTTLASFNGTNGAGLVGPLVQASDGNFYGTAGGGSYGEGTVFKITSSGTLTTVYSFCAQTGCPDGNGPLGGVVQGTDGNLYGVTQYGGSYDNGTVFKITATGTLTTLYSFCAQAGCTDGSGPWAGLLQTSDGNFYGTTTGGGSYGAGTVFKMTSAGMLTTLHSFDNDDGGGPAAALVQGSDGNFYGTTYYGGNYIWGTVFKISPGGDFTSLYSFKQYPYGANPYGSLVQGSDGNFYGTTERGGTNYNCEPGCGTVFTITSSGAFTTLYDFSGPDGFSPYAGLVLGSDGNFYGVTQSGGSSSWCNSYGVSGCGTVFTMTPGGMLTTLHSFDLTDGAGPSSALVQVRNGALYGTTNGGGADGDGTVFRIGLVHSCATCRQ